MHTKTVAAKTNQVLDKSFEYLNINMLLQLYKSFVCPLLEYENTVWGPMFVLDQQCIEKIQRRATKLGFKYLPYVNRLSRLDIDILEVT